MGPFKEGSREPLCNTDKPCPVENFFLHDGLSPMTCVCQELDWSTSTQRVAREAHGLKAMTY